MEAMKYIYLFLLFSLVGFAFEDTAPDYDMYPQDVRDAYSNYLREQENLVYQALLDSFNQIGVVYTAFQDSVKTENEGWLYNDWLGYYYQSDKIWIYHQSLKWIYPHSIHDGYWFWSENFGWLWTNKELFPFMCNQAGGSFYLYQDQGVIYSYSEDLYYEL